MSQTTLAIEKSCIEAREKLSKIGIEDQIQSELDWVLGSYGFDKNPVGLYEVGGKALNALKDYKGQKPRSIAKKVITDFEKALSAQN